VGVEAGFEGGRGQTGGGVIVNQEVSSVVLVGERRFLLIQVLYVHVLVDDIVRLRLESQATTSLKLKQRQVHAIWQVFRGIFFREFGQQLAYLLIDGPNVSVVRQPSTRSFS